MSFGEEYSLFMSGDYASVDSARFNNKLNIENVYSEVNVKNDELAITTKWIHSNDNEDFPEYSVVNLSRKHEERLKKMQERAMNDNEINTLFNNLNIYEEIEKSKAKNDEGNIYEMVRTA
jgi:hypothetical protein